MATKAEERKALEQIEKIIASLGPDSYIGMAMDGMIEDAKENIENDFALSMKDRVETEKKKLAIREEQLDKMSEENKRLKDHLNCVNRNFDELQDRLHETEKSWKKDLEELGEARAMVKWQEDEILHLKAKLYNFMVKEA